jgi:hypothetical protein
MLIATRHTMVSTYGRKPKDVANATPTKSAGESTVALQPSQRGRAPGRSTTMAVAASKTAAIAHVRTIDTSPSSVAQMNKMFAEINEKYDSEFVGPPLHDSLDLLNF